MMSPTSMLSRKEGFQVSATTVSYETLVCESESAYISRSLIRVDFGHSTCIFYQAPFYLSQDSLGRAVHGVETCSGLIRLKSSKRGLISVVELPQAILAFCFPYIPFLTSLVDFQR